MKLIKILGNRLDGMSYKAVAAVMKRNYAGMAKKHKDKTLDEYAEKIGESIDNRDQDEHRKWVAKFRVRMMFLDDQKSGDHVCKFPTCSQKATHVKIDIDKDIHEVFCDKHLQMFLKLEDNEKAKKKKNSELQ